MLWFVYNYSQEFPIQFTINNLYIKITLYINTVKPILRGSIHMKFSMIGPEKGDCLIQMTTCAGLTVCTFLQTLIAW